MHRAEIGELAARAALGSWARFLPNWQWVIYIMTAWHDQYRSLTLFATRACTAAQQGIVANIGTSFGFMVLSLSVPRSALRAGGYQDFRDRLFLSVAGLRLTAALRLAAGGAQIMPSSFMPSGSVK